MKNIFLTFFVLMVFVQTSRSQIDSLSYENTQDITWTVKYSVSNDARIYRTQDGTILKEGSPLMIGRPSTTSGEFTNLFMGKLGIMGNPHLLAQYQAEKVVIEKIKVYHTKMSKQSPMQVTLFVYNPAIAKSAANRSISDYEKALLLGEIINPNAPMTRDEAIKKLKESKDLLDLGMISQVKYDSIKKVLSPTILKSN